MDRSLDEVISERRVGSQPEPVKVKLGTKHDSSDRTIVDQGVAVIVPGLVMALERCVSRLSDHVRSGFATYPPIIL